MIDLKLSDMSYPDLFDKTKAIIERLSLPEHEEVLTYGVQEETNNTILLKSICSIIRTDWHGNGAQELAVYVLGLDNEEKHDFDEFALAMWLNENHPIAARV